MASGGQRDLERLGQAEMQRAGMFWAGFDRAVHRIRYAVILTAHYRCLLRTEATSPNPRGRLVAELARLVDAAHDMRLIEEGNMDSMAEAARGAEIMARIRYEEADGRVHDEPRIPNPQRWDPNG